MFVTNPLKYTCLFGGGAIRGLAYVGTIRALEELDIEYQNIKFMLNLIGKENTYKRIT